MIPVVAIIKAKPGKEKDLEILLKDLVPVTRREPGCGGYDLYHDVADKRGFIFIESWLSEKDLQSHLASPHIQSAMARKEELIETLEIKALQPLD